MAIGPQGLSSLGLEDGHHQQGCASVVNKLIVLILCQTSMTSVTSCWKTSSGGARPGSGPPPGTSRANEGLVSRQSIPDLGDSLGLDVAWFDQIRRK